MQAVALHPDVLVVTSAVLRVNCIIVRRPGTDAEPAASAPTSAQAVPRRAGETFVIDSPVLPDELDALPGLLAQAGFSAPAGLLATHGDWDHLLGPLAFPGVALGCAVSTAERLHASPGQALRDLREFDDDLLIERSRPLVLSSVQALPVPGRCAIGDCELELHTAAGHTGEGMAIVIGWAAVLVAGDYLSPIELPTLNDDGDLDSYLATLERLRPLAAGAAHVVPGHGPVLERTHALNVLDEDRGYLQSVRRHGSQAALPIGRRSAAQRQLHAQNVARVEASSRGLG